MSESPDQDPAKAVEKAVSLTREALALCDKHGLWLAAAHLSTAIDALTRD